MKINITDTRPTLMPAMARFAEAGLPALPAPFGAPPAVSSNSASRSEPGDDDGGRAAESLSPSGKAPLSDRGVTLDSSSSSSSGGCPGGFDASPAWAVCWDFVWFFQLRG